MELASDAEFTWISLEISPIDLAPSMSAIRVVPQNEPSQLRQATSCDSDEFVYTHVDLGRSPNIA